jgi:hypothetical protein
MRAIFGVLLLAVLLAACSSGDDSGDASPEAPGTQGTPADTTLDPSIEDALSCRVPANPPPPGPGNAAMQRHELDPERFPGTACNDGSPALLYFRPYAGEANRDRWVIALEGGGDCLGAQSCADRWCSVDTNFDSGTMSTDFAPQSRLAEGIFNREEDNPFAGWNHVFLNYCSSDVWTGQLLAAPQEAMDPATGESVSWEMHFAGANVFEAALVLLRQDGVEALTYERSDTEMPDLDDAAEVVFAGGSAGGAGVVFNLDRFAERLRADNPGVPIRGLIDSAVGPDESKLGFEHSRACLEAGACTYEALYTALGEAKTRSQGRRTDDSCVAWHEENEPGTEWLCYDVEHVISHHITTPFFVRSGLTDVLRLNGAIDAGYEDAKGELLTPLTFGLATRQMHVVIAEETTSGEEGGDVATSPGVYAPSCSTHYTIYDDYHTYEVRVVGEDGREYSFFDVWRNWLAGDEPAVVISSDPRTDKC